MSKLQPIKNESNIPKQVERVKHWLDLLGLDYVILTDEKDGGFTFLVPIQKYPDINVSLDKEFAHISFFSNGLTRLSEEPDDVIQSFLRQVLKLQSQYFTSRVIITGSNDDVRVFLGFRYDEMSMYRFSRKIRELIHFVQVISSIIDEHKMTELWRDTEQEPKFPTIDVRERVRFL